MLNDAERKAIRDKVDQIEKKYGHCCGDVLNVSAEQLYNELTRGEFGCMTGSDIGCKGPISAAIVGNAHLRAAADKKAALRAAGGGGGQ